MGKDQGPTLRAQWLGQQLRMLRESAGKTLQQSGEYLQRTASLVSRFESAEYPIRRPDLMALLDLYGASDQRQREGLLKLSEEVWRKGWWDGHAEAFYDQRFADYVWLESRAHELRTFDDTLMLGLLQTVDYARAAIIAAEPDASAEQIDRWVELRMARQRILTGNEPPRLSAILDEALLYRRVGGPAVLRDQLRHVVELTQQPNVEVRVLPLRAGAHASPTGTFKLLLMEDPYPDVGYVETPGGAVYAETPGADVFLQRYDRLREATLGADESAELISAAAEESQ